MDHKRAGHAGLIGWREKVADAGAPLVANRSRFDEDDVRAAIGLAFFVLSIYYVLTVTKRLLSGVRS